ncbi:hypothetical protein N4G70_36275 [Streptomyces sp. ASQP_92]|uniref:hypothetical protein n=1 Tax=Streptomyces sp. ASQP_92 TaxID=2979116 RepID=UPI0021BF2828|nr:hypothetical protein [Streptomyces sp. ASQP_92]MCT9094258.1 hypothetical protein [Streptomyces sp. ASQP_92]
MVAAAPAAPATREEQRRLLRSMASYDPASGTWWARIGALNPRAVEILQMLYVAARRFGTEVRLDITSVPATWNGDSSTGAGELAALAVVHTDRTWPLGQLRID